MKRDATVFTCNAEVAKRLDGDLSTYVGPGQILAWLVLDLRLITLLGCTKDHVERAVCSAIIKTLRVIPHTPRVDL